MELGAFSISLAVKDIERSKSFYEKLGFQVYAGEQDQNWLIMKNGDHLVGLFQGMFEENILTFNPGWDQNAQQLESFADARELRDDFHAKGIETTQENFPAESGPASFVVTDPDGNSILIDQHV